MCTAQAETAYTRACLADTEELQNKLYAEMRNAIQEADQTAPVRCEWLPRALAGAPLSQAVPQAVRLIVQYSDMSQVQECQAKRHSM